MAAVEARFVAQLGSRISKMSLPKCFELAARISEVCRSRHVLEKSVPPVVALATVREPVCLAGDGEACGHLVKSLSDSVCPKLRPLSDLY